ncbi:MAG: hypothetical protein R2800_01435 [Flavipsychrobacter sp.]
MIFSRTYQYNSSMRIEDIKNRLLGKHVKVHNLDFEVSENDKVLKIIPHAESVTDIKTLPITHVRFKGEGGKTKIVVKSKMRKIDSGGPTLIMIFCLFLIVAAAIAFFANPQGNITIAYTLGGIGVAVFALFWLRMERGYFDYVRKIRDFIKTQSA